MSRYSVVAAWSLNSVLLMSCGAFRTPYHELVYDAPKVDAGLLLAEATTNPLAVESKWRNQLAQIAGRVGDVTVADQNVGRGPSLSSCADVTCANTTRHAHVARIASAHIVASDGEQPGEIICEFSEKRFDEAAHLERGSTVVIGGQVSRVTVVDSAPIVHVSGCVLPHK